MSHQQPSGLFGPLNTHYRSLKRVYMNLKRGVEISLRFVNALVRVFTPIIFCFFFVFRIVDKIGKYLSWMAYLPLRSKTGKEAAEAGEELRQKRNVCGGPDDMTRDRKNGTFET
ncbi:uncharacterized protein LOC125025997 [Penaeus chinensis]|uniref:uncharacterized protein LOC125025997 n=1 Tax=Penaeus chinensis TaxID=139456 RepID=UPI001FB73B00|nr:uncharacterized protein LOC125025997 [Penaeus chinensis]XP_047470317.1 uncharacterized protein LOC125025997 [Penaeus chinensis]XP_047470318.1 uncharacterized protein LOC125025997 [Penaeus chinensis]XP_047470319.1 uncharacterized protein LOC125025997 [Penaeus chinensis]XP_047470320.1 uncharacterized protein LOC125025997 [Penaeus chinensis]XP_047470321.1 uncharacterized protein LOC125025997 [Penaeus chinensis]XP_047470322.1 uncharacterized protein LOC125025997 [Penaeus chinensis]